MNISDKQIVCHCGTSTERKIISKKIPVGKQNVPLKNVEADVCPNCGEIYFDGKMILDISKKIKEKEILKAA